MYVPIDMRVHTSSMCSEYNLNVTSIQRSVAARRAAGSAHRPPHVLRSAPSKQYAIITNMLLQLICYYN